MPDTAVTRIDVDKLEELVHTMEEKITIHEKDMAYRAINI